MGRLQFIHYNGVNKNFTREQAIEYVNKLTNKEIIKNIGESLIGEPMAVTYLDDKGNKQVLLTIGVEGEKGEGTLTKYHVIDSAKLEEEIVSLSGASEEIKQALEEEIARAIASETSIQNELDNTQTGAGLDNEGNYVKNTEANYIADVNSLNQADVKLDTELARVEKARKDVTGQQQDIYIPNQSLISRPLKYINTAIDLNDADIKLDEGIQKLNDETVKNIKVNNVEGEVVNNVAEVTIDAHDINIGEYEHYEGIVTEPHQIHDNYSALDAVKQLDVNFMDFAEKEILERKGIHIVKITSGLDSNVKEAYDLVDKEGHVMENSERILIYKDSSLYRVYLGHVDDTITSPTDPTIIPGTGDTALCFIYFKVDGTYQLVTVNVQDFLQESEFKKGLEVINHEVNVKVDESSENFLSVSINGVKLSGVQNSIDSSVLTEKTRAVNKENELDSKILSLSGNVTILSSSTTSEINRISNEILSEEIRAINKENELDSKILSLSGAIDSEVTRAQNAENVLNNAITNEVMRAQGAESTLNSAISSEVTRAQDVENALNNAITNEVMRAQGAENTLNSAINSEITRAQDVENSLNNAIINEVNNRQQAITDEISNREFADARLEGMINEANSNISINSENINREKERATNAENIISANTIVLSENVTAFSSSTKTAIDNINQKISVIESKTINGKDAINVLVSGNTSTVSLTLNSVDKILDQDVSGLKTTISLSVASDGKTIYLRGKNDAVISQIDSSLFVKDGMLDDVTFDNITNKLVFKFNNDAQKEQIEVPLNELVKIYTVSGGSENYLAIQDFKIGAKVDVTNGLASYNSVSNLEEKVIQSATTINNSLNTLSSATNEIKNNLNNEINRATNKENELEDLIKTKINIHGINSIRVDSIDSEKLISLKFNPTDQVLTEDGSGLKTNLSLNYTKEEGKIYLKGKPNGIGNEIISEIDVSDFTNFKISALTSEEISELPDSTNIKEAYKLINSTNEVLGDIIKIYKDSSLYRVYLGHVDDTITSSTDPTIIPGSGDTALCFIYYKVDGTYELVAVNVEDFLEESEFKDGLQVNNHVVSVKIDNDSETFLSVNENGVKLSGVQNAIDVEKTRAVNVENLISGEVVTLREIIEHDEEVISASLNDLNERVNSVDGAITSEVTRATSAETVLNNAITAETSARQTGDNTLNSKIDTEVAKAISSAATSADTLNSKIDSEVAKAIASAATSADTLNNIIKDNEEVISATISKLTNDFSKSTDEIRDIIKEDEEVVSASISKLTNEISSVNSDISELRTVVDDNEEITAASLVDLNERVDTLSATLDEDEKIIASSLTDLNTRINMLMSKIETLENIVNNL